MAYLIRSVLRSIVLSSEVREFLVRYEDGLDLAVDYGFIDGKTITWKAGSEEGRRKLIFFAKHSAVLWKIVVADGLTRETIVSTAASEEGRSRLEFFVEHLVCKKRYLFKDELRFCFENVDGLKEVIDAGFLTAETIAAKAASEEGRDMLYYIIINLDKLKEAVDGEFFKIEAI